MDSYLKEATKKHSPRRLPIRIVRRILSRFDPTQGFWIIILSLSAVYLLPIGLILLGVRYGAVGFYGGVAAVLSLGTYILDKRYGRHLQVEDFALLKKTLALVPALLIILTILILMLHFAGKL